MMGPIIFVSHPLENDSTKRGVCIVGDHEFITCTKAEDVKLPCTLDNIFKEIDAWKQMEPKEDLDIYDALKNVGNSAYVCFFDNLFLLGIASMTLPKDQALTLGFLNAFLIHPNCRRKTLGTRLFHVIVNLFRAPDIKDVFGYIPKYILITTSVANVTFWGKQGFAQVNPTNMLQHELTDAEKGALIAMKLTTVVSGTKLMAYNF